VTEVTIPVLRQAIHQPVDGVHCRDVARTQARRRDELGAQIAADAPQRACQGEYSTRIGCSFEERATASAAMYSVSRVSGMAQRTSEAHEGTHDEHPSWRGGRYDDSGSCPARPTF
jgi:hypothetical protein